jgi:uncharacterized protein (TIGR02246 family)
MVTSTFNGRPRHALRRRIFAVCSSLLLAAPIRAGENKPKAEPPEVAIRATARAFVDAFNRGDAKAVAAQFTDAATMADDRGEIVKGRSAIEAEYAVLFKAHPGMKMEVSITSLEFPSSTTVIEDGVAKVTAKGTAGSASRYTAVHVLENGQWLMASVRETRIEIPSNFARLENLQRLIGTWENKGEGTTVRATFQWIAHKSFVERSYSVSQGGAVTSCGVQIIGWDPQASQIKSWSFDSSGGLGTGYWTVTPEGWRIDNLGVAADGTPTSSRDFLIRVAGEDRVLGWRSVDRQIGKTKLPDTAEVVLDRVMGKQ